ncbi:cell division-specific peptidoglycan biosynthesis regulator FtsW [Pedococcus dokdonensis]|uniref:Probable peptidoglycan glycosyltransferase FtsW n=1 Tax=Pedococcus dokdonensis TaxID=443156 RepID=A0A1H0MKH1_9MICO|nr:putative lipid II flippase FtsW [Pedococcus dokdonensis]SDO80805.1 cell division-specific peptidoglycan biosynthesis regulator FtsW [Pedococcus dokdonensis]
MSSATAAPARARTASRAADGSTDAPGRFGGWFQRLDSPVTSYYVLLSVTVVLVVIGLIMVLSASSVKSLVQTDNATPYVFFRKQLQFAAMGAVAIIVASRVPLRVWKALSLPILVGALFLQLLVFTPLGVSVNGNRNWLALGPISLQPSEFAKVGLVLVGATVLTAKRKLLGRLRHVIIPFLVPVAAVTIGLVLLGHDLGTVMVMGGIVAALLFAAGVPRRMFVYGGALFGALAVTMVLTSANRLQRFDVWLGKDTNPYGGYRQTLHGRYALADGGWWGVGLGASREKWQWLPEAHNDFIFAILGEELGLPGTLVLLGLFCALALVCYRIVLRTNDTFVRIATAGVMAWIVCQATINIGAVIGLLPVIGVPLPLVSYGGSSLMTTMFALGMLLSFARQEPGCREALSAKPSVVRRSLAVLPGRRGRR